VWGIPQNLALADLQKIATLGSGAFGQVSLVKSGAKFYALKALSKAQILEMGLQVRSRPLHIVCISRHDAWSCTGYQARHLRHHNPVVEA
jgi:hypothetical protein